MGMVVSLLMIAAGAVMRFAVTVQGHGFNVHTTGVILIVVGAIGAVMSMVYWASWGGFSGARGGAVAAPGAERTVVTEREIR